MNNIAINPNSERLPERKSHLFRPYFCWRHNDGTLRDFWRSRIQVAMCHTFSKDDKHIIEVDIRPDLSGEEPKFWGLLRQDGEIDYVYPNIVQTKVCGGPRNRIFPVEVVVLDEVNTVDHCLSEICKQLQQPPLSIELKALED